MNVDSTCGKQIVLLIRLERDPIHFGEVLCNPSESAVLGEERLMDALSAANRFGIIRYYGSKSS